MLHTAVRFSSCLRLWLSPLQKLWVLSCLSWLPSLPVQHQVLCGATAPKRCVWTRTTLAKQLTCAQTGNTLLPVLQGFHTAQVAGSSPKPGQMNSSIRICQLCLLQSRQAGCCISGSQHSSEDSVRLLVHSRCCVVTAKRVACANRPTKPIVYTLAHSSHSCPAWSPGTSQQVVFSADHHPGTWDV